MLEKASENREQSRCTRVVAILGKKEERKRKTDGNNIKWHSVVGRAGDQPVFTYLAKLVVCSLSPWPGYIHFKGFLASPLTQVWFQ